VIAAKMLIPMLHFLQNQPEILELPRLSRVYRRRRGTSTRTYTNSEAASKEDHEITFTDVTPYASFTVNWYNTWDGGLYYDTETKTSDANGTLTIEVGTLATTSRDPSEAWDGADCILVIEEVQ